MRKASEVRVGVTPYVKKYILRTYGPGEKYDLTLRNRSDLRISLINLDYTAEIPLLPSRGPGSNIVFDLGDDPHLVDTYTRAERWIKVRAYFEHEFNVILKNYLAAQAELAERLNLSQTQYNARIGLESFLEKYGIEDWEYSYDSLRRQWHRLKQKDYSDFYGLLSKKLGFRVTDNQGLSYKVFTPAHVVGVQDLVIWFTAYSRSAEDIIVKRLRIPPKLIASGDWVEWSDIAINYINSQLRRGCTVK